MDLEQLFRGAGCEGSLAAVRLADGESLGFQANRVHVMASVVKVPIALEFYEQVASGRIDPQLRVCIESGTPGPVGISRFRDPVDISLRDLAYLMLTVSDNAATDVITEAVGIEAVNDRLRRIDCRNTTVVGTLREMLDRTGADLGFSGYAELLSAQAGALGPEARERSIDPERLARCAALDPERATHTTAADATRLLAAIWDDTAASAMACAAVRETMAEQVTQRLRPAVPQGGSIAAKSGGLFRRVRNEIAVITDPDGARYAVAVLTRADSADSPAAAIEAAMVTATKTAVERLRQA